MKNFSITKLLISIAFLGCVTCGIHAMETYQVSSPSGKVKLEINQAEDGLFYYSFTGGNKTLLKESRLGYQLTNGEDLPGKRWFVSSLSRRTHSDVWYPVWGKRRAVSDCYNELTLQVATNEQQAIDEMQLEFRVYNEGVAFRYVVPQRQKGRCKVSGELTNYVFTGDYSAWFYNGEYANIGPEKLSESAGTRSPVMTVKADATHYMAIHEADLRHGMPLSLTSRKGETTFEVEKKPAELSGGFTSAWRVLFYGDTPGVMVDSHLVELLNPDPSSDYDFSWVKPGIAVWDWRINGAKVGAFTYTMSYPSWIRMVDFASEQGFNYLVLDANWYGPEFEKNSDPTVGDKANDVRKLIAYSKAKGVGIWLYLNDVGGRQYPLAQTLKQYSKWGAAGVKYGFMKGNMEEKNERTRLITQLCAQNKLFIDFHDGPVHPYGQLRTWPNAVTREFCEAQLDAHRVFQPETFVTTVFVNMLAGPLDMNNGIFDLRQGPTTRVDESQPVPATLASEAARTLIVFSGVTILPDIPENYQKYPSLLRFISAQKMPWVESQTLQGEIGKYIVMMRETDDAYLVAGATNEEGRTVTIPLNFLPKGKTFSAELTTDGREADYLKNREVIQTTTPTVSRTTPLTVHMAPGGGFCVMIKK